MTTRRDFLRRSAGLSGLAAAPLSSWLSLQALSQAAAQGGGGQPTGYRALVCLFLSGGNDSFNMLVPRPHADPTGNWSGVTADGTTGEDEWKAYCTLRGSVRLPQLYTGALGATVRPLKKADGSLHGQALNGHMPRLQAIFNNEAAQGLSPLGRHAAFVANVGPLVEPVTAAQVRTRSKLLPLHLQSHSDQIEQWQTCFPQGQSRSGWAGRLLDTLHPQAGSTPRFSLISLDGMTPALNGFHSAPFADLEGSRAIEMMTGLTSSFTARRLLLQQVVSSQTDANAQQNVLTNAYLQSLDAGLGDTMDYAGLLKDTHLLASALSDLNLGHGLVRRLRRVAQIIRAFRTNSSLPRRQVFFVNFGGWDHHDKLAGQHQSNLEILDSAVAEFYTLMKGGDGLGDNALADVTLFTASDFGRALAPNGDGTDHGWGGHHLVVGGGVNGGEIYGQYPAMKLQGASAAAANADPTNLDIYGNGVMMPTLAVDQYMQRLGRWFLQGTAGAGWNVEDATGPWSNVLPNWGGFRPATGEVAPLDPMMQSI